MIKVIKYGPKHRVMCGNCRSILEYEDSDTQTVQMGMNEWEKYINCPVCDEKIRVRDS